MDQLSMNLRITLFLVNTYFIIHLILRNEWFQNKIVGEYIKIGNRSKTPKELFRKKS